MSNENEQIQQLANENADLKRTIKDLQAQLASIDGAAMDLMRSSHQTRTKLILTEGIVEDYKNTLALMTKQYQDEQAKVEKLNNQLIENAGADKQ